MISTSAGQQPPSTFGPLTSVIDLARLSRVTLLYHGPVAMADLASREQAAAIAAAAHDSGDDVVVLFDAGGDMLVPDLLSAIEVAVLQAYPQAPLAPPMAGPVEALAFWQDTLGMRFMLIFYRFDLALANPDPEFDETLLHLTQDRLALSLLLVMEESAAPLLHRLRDALPDLGEAYLRLPEPAGAVPATDEGQAEPPPLPPTPAPEPPPRFQASPFLLTPEPDEDMTIEAPASDSADADPHIRRSRRFSTLLEEARAVPDDTPPPLFPAVPAAATHALRDGRMEPSLSSPQPATPAPSQRVFRERQPLQVPAWMHKRTGRRRRAILAIVTRAGSSATILFVFLLALAMLGWQLPQLSASVAASGSAPAQAMALRGNR